MKNRIITISREFGSGGRTIGRKLAENLGIRQGDEVILRNSDLEELHLTVSAIYDPANSTGKRI